MNKFGWFVLVVFSVFIGLFLFVKLFFFGLGEAIRSDEEKQSKEIENIKAAYVDRTVNIKKSMIEDLSSSLEIKQESKIFYTPQNPVKVNSKVMSESDRRCNKAIFLAMSDKSEEAQKAKKQACSYIVLN